ncbi:MAG: hypothetical protein J6V53_07045 [Alphaproteobacteria bacterium]|nr:hypothetical protein [Alphaproteobacteria bacterium]
MNSSDDICISNNKSEQGALLYGLINPLFEPNEAKRIVKHFEKEAKRDYQDKNLQFLYIFASLLNLNPKARNLNRLYEHIPVKDEDLKIVAGLHILAERGNLSLSDAAKKVTALDEEMKNQIKDKNLRLLTIISLLTEKGAEPICLAKHLFCIQRIITPEKQR